MLDQLHYLHLLNADKKLRHNLNVFCFPYAGGGTNTYKCWPKYLPEWCNVIAIRLPGREKLISKEPFTNVHEAANALYESISPLLNKPYVFFGHSLGATLLYEIAIIIRDKNKILPLEMWVSGQRGPQIPDPDPPIYNLPNEEFIEEIKKYGATPDEIFHDEDMMKLVLPKLRADFCIIDTYKYKDTEPFSVPIIAFGSNDDDEVSINEVNEWKSQTTNTFEFNILSGDHFFIYSDQKKLLDKLNMRIGLIKIELNF